MRPSQVTPIRIVLAINEEIFIVPESHYHLEKKVRGQL
jgi:hypothetical protein